MATRQFLRVWNEAATGQGSTYAEQPFTPPGSPVLNTDYVVVRLEGDNAFTMRPTPIQKSIRAVDGGNRKVQLTQGQTSVSGNVSTLFYPTQAPFWANLLTLNGTSGDLPSFVCDHAILMESGTIAYRRYLGCKFDTVTLSGDSSSNLIKFAGQIIASQPQLTNITVGTFPEPSYTVFPSEIPYLFTNFSGGITMNSATRIEYKSFSLTIDPILDGTFNEGQYISRLRYCGRDIQTDMNFVYQSTNDRNYYEAATAQTAFTATLTAGSHTCAFTMNNANYISKVNDSLPLGNVFYEDVTFQTYMDYTTGADFSITAT